MLKRNFSHELRLEIEQTNKKNRRNSLRVLSVELFGLRLRLQMFNNNSINLLYMCVL